LLDTLNKLKPVLVINDTDKVIIFIRIQIKIMQENFSDYQFCIKETLDNAKKRINLLDNFDKKSVLEEYKEWINDGLNKHTVLLLREDPII
tara:strand:- start:811 stop:1083 length:273 start_codon:yes stop_codon:yes gene_type:complete